MRARFRPSRILFWEERGGECILGMGRGCSTIYPGHGLYPNEDSSMSSIPAPKFFQTMRTFEADRRRETRNENKTTTADQCQRGWQSWYTNLEPLGKPKDQGLSAEAEGIHGPEKTWTAPMLFTCMSPRDQNVEPHLLGSQARPEPHRCPKQRGVVK